MAPNYSSGHLIRDAHRAMQRHLEDAITQAGVARGQWYFLRVLWEGDGLTQRELSARVGMMEPTTVVALNGMEKSGLIRRERNPDDRRKIHIYLTEKGSELRTTLLPLARQVNERAEVGIPPEDLEGFRRAIAFPDSLENHSQIVSGLPVLRLKPQNSLIFLDRLFVLPRVRVGEGEIVTSRCVVRLQ